MTAGVPPDDQIIRMSRVAQSTASAVIITDTTGVTIWVNDGFTRITGYSFTEAVGRSPGKLLQGADTDPAEVARIAAALRSRQRVAAELVNYAKDGRRYWVGMKIEPLFDANDEFEGFMAIEADITERHEEREAFKQLNRRFNIATRAARVGIFERDAHFEIQWWSDVTWDMFGQNPATFTPSNESWLKLIHPDDRERIRREVEHLKKDLSPINLQYRIIRPDGEIRHMHSIGAPAESTDGAVEHIGGIVIDVTERAKAEERAQALQHQLRESSHQAGMAVIATGILHNVGNVLNSLGTANTTARRDVKALRFEQLEQVTHLLLDNREHLATFLNDDERGRHLPDYLSALSAHISSKSRVIQAELETTEQLLLHLSNIVSAQQELAHSGGLCEPLNVTDLVETALLVQASELARFEVVRDYEELPPIMTDRHKLLQIVVNLISNARDAVAAVVSGRRRILVKLALDATHVQLTVEDTGIGMSAEVLSQLWRFGFTTKPQGHGFGLHNSANAAAEIGATLMAHSDGVDRGARFTLRLPRNNACGMLSGAAA